MAKKLKIKRNKSGLFCPRMSDGTHQVDCYGDNCQLWIAFKVKRMGKGGVEHVEGIAYDCADVVRAMQGETGFNPDIYEVKS
tara:strand:- start:240 stop:485 length:246 start_codon:yes stop_codon:yes gene_type:complete